MNSGCGLSWGHVVTGGISSGVPSLSAPCVDEGTAACSLPRLRLPPLRCWPRVRPDEMVFRNARRVGHGRAMKRLTGRPEWRFFAVLPRADRKLATAWWVVLVARGVLPAGFAIATGVLVAAVQS